jgi:hypothetical protein
MKLNRKESVELVKALLAKPAKAPPRVRAALKSYRRRVVVQSPQPLD